MTERRHHLEAKDRRKHPAKALISAFHFPQEDRTLLLAPPGVLLCLAAPANSHRHPKHTEYVVVELCCQHDCISSHLGNLSWGISMQVCLDISLRRKEPLWRCTDGVLNIIQRREAAEHQGHRSRFLWLWMLSDQPPQAPAAMVFPTMGSAPLSVSPINLPFLRFLLVRGLS